MRVPFESQDAGPVRHRLETAGLPYGGADGAGDSHGDDVAAVVKGDGSGAVPVSGAGCA